MIGKTKVLIFCVFMLIATAVFSEEHDNTADKDKFWTFEMMISAKASINPWLFTSDALSISRGLNLGAEITPGIGPISFAIGYQFMGVLTAIDNRMARYYFESRDISYLVCNEHLITFVPMFQWHRGVFRPYIGAGVSLNIYDYTLKSDTTSGGAENIYKLGVGISMQTGINFVIKKFVIGVGADMNFKNLGYLTKIAQDPVGLLSESTYLVLRLGGAL